MRLKNIPGSREEVEGSAFASADPGSCRGRWRDRFPVPGPLHAEIGMGKGQFLMEMARLHPDICYLGIEKYSSVLVKAVRKQEAAKLPNLRFLMMDAKNLTEAFAEDELDRIYLNFPDPWPKERHADRRLTSERFLALYDIVLRRTGTLELKTDNRALFDFSVESVRRHGWQVEAVTRDLHHSALAAGNVMTEYEEKFSAAGNPICRLICRPQVSSPVSPASCDAGAAAPNSGEQSQPQLKLK